MDTEARVKFNRMIASAEGVDDPRVSEAFATVPRERFVGAGPWMLLDGDGYVATSDPASLYEDVVVALLPGKRINNGQPSLHARCLSAAQVKPGERVLHIGCGSGYYTAILSELTTPSGQVEGWDIEAELVRAAAANLAGRRGVRVRLRDATAGALGTHDVIYVCAGCTRPVRAWAEALSEDGRLLFPLTPGWAHGGMLLVTRIGKGFAARFVCRCAFIPCVGGSAEAEKAALFKSISRRPLESVASLHFGDAPRTNVWLAGRGWWLGESPALH